MLSNTTSEITTQTILDCDTLQEVKNLCEVEEITLTKQELDLLSEKWKLPYFNVIPIDYLLKCSRLVGVEAIREFLKYDDVRVLEYYPVDEVITTLFPREEKTYDCPRITKLLLEKEEWDDVCSDICSFEPDYPLVCIVKNNLEKTLQVLLNDERTIVGMPSLVTAIELHQMETLTILLSHHFLDIGICKEEILAEAKAFGLDVTRVQELLSNVKDIIF